MKKKFTVFIMLFFVIVQSIPVYGKEQTVKEPEVIEKATTKIVLLEFGGACLTPYVFGYAAVTDDSFSTENECCGANMTGILRIPGFFVFMSMTSILYPFAIPFSVSYVGNYHNQGGSYWAALAGGVTAFIIPVGLLGNTGVNKYGNSLHPYLLFAYIAGSVIGYNLSKPKPTGTNTGTKSSTRYLTGLNYSYYRNLQLNLLTARF